jgi:hypothetical protein
MSFPPHAALPLSCQCKRRPSLLFGQSICPPRTGASRSVRDRCGGGPGIQMRSGSIRVNPAQSGQKQPISVGANACHTSLPTVWTIPTLALSHFSSLTPRHSLPKTTSQKRDEPHDDSRLKTRAPQEDRGAQLIVRLALAMQRPAPLPVPLFERLRSCFSIP